jgi:acyl-CoA reductase-like NAD-dependent aldehyde dehydrogenase
MTTIGPARHNTEAPAAPSEQRSDGRRAVGDPHRVAAASPETVHAAVARARQAARAWAATSPTERCRLLVATRRLLVERLDELVDVVVAETGKLAVEAVVNEALVTEELLGWLARQAPKALRPERVPAGLLRHKRAEKRYEPLGVVGVISPWNYPLVLSLGPVATALAAGNAVVLKPSEVTPRTGLAVGKLVDEARRQSGAPEGLLEVVVGAGEVGAALVDAGVDKVAFTGSVATGKAVMARAAATLTPVLLELGGKDPMIVAADADLDRAAAAAVWGAFTNCGQTCMATERVYVVEEVYDAFVRKVCELTSRLRQGAGPGADVGAVVHEGQLRVIEAHLADALERGATVLVGGTRVMVGDRPSLEPTVLVDVDHSMAVMRDETFGPILPIMKVRDLDEAITLANDSPYGLNASVFSSDRATIERLVSKLETGTVCVNDVMVSYAIPGLPFGGVKQSGIGRAHGIEGIREFTRTKSVAYDRLGLRREPYWLPIPRGLERAARWFLRARVRRSVGLPR